MVNKNKNNNKNSSNSLVFDRWPQTKTASNLDPHHKEGGNKNGRKCKCSFL